MLMEGWSLLNDGSDLYEAGIVQTFRSKNKTSFDINSSVRHGNVDGCNERLRGLFDQVVKVFLGEVCGERCIRPIPALLGDGQAADLFKLFWAVWKRDGYDSATQKGLWALVTEECGLDGGMMASVKLVHLKYLNELDQWLRAAIKGESLGSGESEIGGKFSLLLLELRKEFRGLLCNEDDVKKKYGAIMELEGKRNGLCNDLDIDTRELLLPAARDINEEAATAEETINDDDEKSCFDGENKDGVSDTGVIKQVYTSQKRKRESLSLLGMLNWVVKVAKHPDDPAIRRLSECSKWKDYSSEEFWVQALWARDVLLTRRHVPANTDESVLQKKLKMHPSMYEDCDVNNRSAEGLRCSDRLPSSTKPRFCPCCNSCSASHNKVVTAQNKVLNAGKVEVENKAKEQPHLSVEILGTNSIGGLSIDELPLQKHVSVGPLFQVEVPEWSGVAAESDSKWLGTRIWPLQNRKYDSLKEIVAIGKGREDSCYCQLPGSVRCVRFHIAENRMKLKPELGSSFYHWRFDRMGEEVSLSWTIAEEKRFKDMVRLKPPSLNQFFWDVDVLKFFPTKTREKLVRYYFNVFLVRHRAYQNRVTPKDIDSDDDETEFGCVGDSYGFEALNVPRPKLLTCAENKQCTDFQ